MSTFYAYVHARPDMSIFYVGKGKGMRSHVLKGRGRHHQNIINKYGAEKILVGRIECSSEESAFELERGLIKCLRRSGVELANRTDGGEGTSGYRHTEEAKLKCKIAATGKNNAFYGKKRPEHSKILRGRARPGHSEFMRKWFEHRPVGWTSPTLGKPATEERKEKMRASCAERGVAEQMSARFKGVPKSIEHRTKISDSAKGHVWLNKDGKRTHCSEEKAKELELKGWKRGQK